MSPTSDPTEKNRRQYAFNLTLAVVTGQVGCLTLVIILAALFGGLFLDSRFDTRPAFTVGLMIASVPVTLVAMVWVVRAATSRITHTAKPTTEYHQEETKREKKSDFGDT